MAQRLGEPVTSQLKSLRIRSGLSMAAIARALGYKGASSYQRYEDPNIFKEDYLPLNLVRELVPILAGKGQPAIIPQDVLDLAGVELQRDGRLAPTNIDSLLSFAADQANWPRVEDEPSVYIPVDSRGETIAPPSLQAMPRDVPVLGTASCGDGGDFELNGQVVDYLRRPPGLAGAKRVFAIFPQGDSMWPRYEEGEPVFVHPDRPVRVGRDVLVELHAPPGKPAQAYLKRLVRRNASTVILHQFNPARDLTIETRLIRSIFPVLTPAEILGMG